MAGKPTQLVVKVLEQTADSILLISNASNQLWPIFPFGSLMLVPLLNLLQR